MVFVHSARYFTGAPKSSLYLLYWAGEPNYPVDVATVT